MTRLALFLLLTACSGAEFHERVSDEKSSEGGDTSAIGGSSGEGPSVGGGGLPSSGSIQNGYGGLGNSGSQGGMGPGTAGTGSGGASAMAGGPSMGEGGNGNAGAGNAGPRVCLANFQSLDCARICTNSVSDCQAVLNCYVVKNSLDGCSDFTNIGISLAESAERACCNVE